MCLFVRFTDSKPDNFIPFNYMYMFYDMYDVYIKNNTDYIHNNH